MQDLKFAFRQLLKNPGFTAVAVFTLALAIGAGTAVFSLVNAILLRSLPVPNPHELRLIHWSGTDWESRVYQNMTLVKKGSDHSGKFLPDAVSLNLFHALRERCVTQAEIFGYMPLFDGSTFRARHEAIRAEGLLVSDNFFFGLGVRPLAGRLLGPSDELANATPAIVISYRLWEQQFDLDPNAVGQSVLVGTSSFTIVGVLPREFLGIQPGAKTDFYVPLSAHDRLVGKIDFNSWCIALMARVKPGIADSQCQSALSVVFARETERVMKNPKVWTTPGRGGTDNDRVKYGGSLRLLLGVVGLVLLVACANLSGLMLARGTARLHEFAVRAALGASRARLVGPSLTESLLIALMGGGAGLLLAIWGKDALGNLLSGAPDGLHYDTSLDFRVLSFTVVLSLITALASGVLPAWRAGRVDPLCGLKARMNSVPHLRLGRFLVVAQITLSLVLVSGAGLFVRTLINLTRFENTGYVPDHLLVFKLYPRDVNSQHAFEFFDRVRESLATIPGVRSAAFSAWPSGDYGFELLGRETGIGHEVPASLSFVSESFFTTMGIPLLLGREAFASDNSMKSKVVVVNETFVRKYLPNRNPVGLVFKRGEMELQIVGVCRNAKYMGMDIRREAPPMVHFSSRQMHPHFACFVLRTALPPLAVTSAARKVVNTIDPNVPLTDISTQERVRDAAIANERTFAELCGSLALLAVLLSGIGLYGLVAYQVARRTGEIGIRQALGATRWQIVEPIARETLAMTGIGVIIGSPLALGFSRLIRSNFFGVGPFDPATHCTAVLLVLIVAIAAAWFPARRAAKVDPMEALRCE